MRARAIVPSVIVAACAACVSTQDLGAFSSSSEAGDAAPSSSAASDPREGFVLPLANKSCPASAPNPGDPCGVASGECVYETRNFDQIGRSVCGRTCACGVRGAWICVDAHCPELDLANCHQNVACVGDMRCWADCNGAGDGCQRCECRDGRMECTSPGGPQR